MDGDFLIQDTTDMVSGVGGGNFLVLAESQEQTLTACEAAVASMRRVPNVIMPFPGGVVRSGSKVGSKYRRCGPRPTTRSAPRSAGSPRRSSRRTSGRCSRS